MASIAVLPVLIGLAVDYAIQFQARFDEARADGLVAAAGRGRGGGARRPGDRHRRLATAAGFLVLLLSPIPMVRGFGLLLVVGIVIAFVLALTAGLAALSLTGARRRRRAARRSARPARGRGRLAPRRGARVGASASARSGGGPSRSRSRARAGCSRSGWCSRSPAGRPGPGPRSISDIRELVPARPARAAERRRAPGGDRRLGRGRRRGPRRRPHRPRGDRLDGATTSSGCSTRAGFGGDDASCVEQDAELCPDDRAARPLRRRSRPGPASAVEGVLDLLPPYFSQAVVSRDPRRRARRHGGDPVRDQGDAVRRAEAADRRDPRRDRPARDRERPAGRGRAPRSSACRCSPPTRTRRSTSNRYLLTLAGLARGRAGAARGLPLGRAGRSCR